MIGFLKCNLISQLCIRLANIKLNYKCLLPTKFFNIFLRSIIIFNALCLISSMILEILTSHVYVTSVIFSPNTFIILHTTFFLLFSLILPFAFLFKRTCLSYLISLAIKLKKQNCRTILPHK